MSLAPRNQRIGWPQVVRDIVLRIVGKGQLLMLVAGIIILVIVLRMPTDDISKLAFRLLEIFEVEKLLGYGLWFITLIMWGLHSKFQRRIIHDEMERLSEERTKLQTLKLGHQIKPSGRK